MLRNFRILTSFWFLLGLVILLLNDLVLKGVFNNWLTGKLSDFAGLLVFPLFWVAIFSNHTRKIHIITGLLFIYWKSPMSQVLITTWNNIGLFPIARVVDYSDLMALSVLPFSYIISHKTDSRKSIRIPPIVPLLVASFAFMATSYSTDIDTKKTIHFLFQKTHSKRDSIYFR